MQKALQESNLATEVGLIVLDCIGLYSIQFRDSMLESLVLPKIARVYLRFLQLGQSETLFKHVFAALRAFINNFSQAIFKGNAMLCGQLVYELLKCCDSRLATVRQESCAVLYLLMRSNFEFTGRKGLTRVHLQVIFKQFKKFILFHFFYKLSGHNIRLTDDWQRYRTKQCSISRISFFDKLLCEER